MEHVKKQDRILFVTTNEISLLDIPRVLDELGYDVYEADFGLVAQSYEEQNCSKIKAAIKEVCIKYVITYDFIVTVAQACMEEGIPYISWVYDAPQKELYSYYAQYPCNYIFSFDKMQVQRLRNIGIKHVICVPLAIHAEKVRMVADTIGRTMKGGYETDITFIGQLYKRENEEAVWSRIDEKFREQLYQNIDACFMKWDKYTSVHGLMSEECALHLNQLDGNRVTLECPYISPQFYYEASFLSRIVANRERVNILNKLAEKYDVTFYTKEEDVSQLSTKVKIKPGVSYDVLTHIYRRSKINLNVTLHCIETGAPQRVLDVMAAGGFMLSNYQEELEEMFIPDEEIVLYHNEQELEEKIAYYLSHDEEREKIARRGQEKVLREYDFGLWLEKSLTYVAEAETDRTESYVTIQAKEITAQANLLLMKKDEEAYEQLYDLLTENKYNATMRKKEELFMLREMLKCWQYERQMGTACIFNNIDNVQQAEQKYLRLNHGLWRIEQDLSYERCMEAIEYIRENEISMLFVAWLVYTNLEEQEKTFLKLAELMSETNLIEAVRLLSHGLMVLEGNQNLLVQQANYLLELQLWDQALTTLKKIEEPTEEVKDIMMMLDNLVSEASV